MEIDSWTRNIWGGRLGSKPKYRKIYVYSEKFLSWDDFQDVLAIFCSYDYRANSSEAIEKIATDEKDYHKCSLCVIAYCIITLNGINKSEKNSY